MYHRVPPHHSISLPLASLLDSWWHDARRCTAVVDQRLGGALVRWHQPDGIRHSSAPVVFILMWVLQTWCAAIGNQIYIMYRLKSVHIKWSSMCLKACAPQDMHYTHKKKWSCVQVVTQKLRVVQFHTKSWSSRHVQYIISFPQPMSRICGGWNLSKEGLLKRTRVIWVTGSMVTSNLI